MMRVATVLGGASIFSSRGVEVEAGVAFRDEAGANVGSDPPRDHFRSRVVRLNVRDLGGRSLLTSFGSWFPLAVVFRTIVYA